MSEPTDRFCRMHIGGVNKIVLELDLYAVEKATIMRQISVGEHSDFRVSVRLAAYRLGG